MAEKAIRRRDRTGNLRNSRERVFCEELESNTVSLHYTLREPEVYGIEHSTVTFGNFTVGWKRDTGFCGKLTGNVENFSL